MKKRIYALLLVLLMGVSGCGASQQDEPVGGTDTEVEDSTETEAAESAKEQVTDPDSVPDDTGEIFAMDTYMTVKCYGDRCSEAVDAALAEITRLDELLSVGNPDSEIAVINANGSGTVSDDTMEMLQCAMNVSERSGGAFDITVYPLMELWGFTDSDMTDEKFQVPSDEALENVLQNVDYSKVSVDETENTVSIGTGQGIDLGGVAKGFTSTRIMEIFQDYDLVSGMVSLGGNVQVYGTKVDGSLWKCGICDPNHPDSSTDLMGILQISDCAVITSGAYERNYTDQSTGNVYHHIIDPKTGYPAEAGIISATIVTSDGTLADTLSTTCYVMGLEKSEEYWQQYGDDFDMILMTEDNQIYITEGIADHFSSDYPVNIIERN